MTHHVQHVTTMPNLAELKAFPGNVGGVVLLLGRNTPGDGGGGNYFWDASSTENEDLTDLSTVKVTSVTTGRWQRVFNRLRQLPHGYLLTNGGVKSFWSIPYATNASSECAIYLTEDNTANGAALFTEIFLNHSAVISNAGAVNDVIFSNVKSTTANRKQTTHIYARGASTTGISVQQIFNTIFPGLRAVPQNTPIRFKIEGI